MSYLLDTCVISEMTKPKPSPAVMAWIATIPSDALFLSVITIGEVRKGIIKLPDSPKKERLAEWLNTLLETYTDRLLAIDLSVSERWGILQGEAEQAGTPLSTLDGLIAATASVHDLTVVTRNERDFLPSHVTVLNPWICEDDEGAHHEVTKSNNSPNDGVNPTQDGEGEPSR